MSRMDETLPTDVDVIVLGTGLPESVLAAAAARVGFTVLHLDRNEYYGGPWASFNLEGITKWAEEQRNLSNAPSPSISFDSVQLGEGERLVPVNSENATVGVTYSNVEVSWQIMPSVMDGFGKPMENQIQQQAQGQVGDQVQEQIEVESHHEIGEEKQVDPQIDTDEALPKIEESPDLSNLTLNDDLQANATVQEKILDDQLPSATREDKPWTYERIASDWRRFSLDLVPKILLGRGEMVQLLSNSGVGRYAEFRTVNRLLTFYDDSLRMVPCSRSDVFQSTEVTMLEKRALMKFIMFCLNYDVEPQRSEWQGFAGAPFSQFLSSSLFQLTEKLRHYAIHALAMVAPSTKTSQALESIHQFLLSSGRYGSSPFLWTLYGSGELAQCFCRCCAVFGGIYCLRRSPQAWIFDSTGNCTGIVSDGQRITCRKLVTDCSYVPNDLTLGKDISTETVSRAILLTDKSILKGDDKEYVSLLNHFSESLPEPVKILESGGGGYVCPRGLFVVHMTTRGNDKTTARNDLDPVVKSFFRFGEDAGADDGRPMVLWSLFFNCTSVTIRGQVADNVAIVSGVDGELTFAGLVPQISKEFSRLWPDTDFLPALPNPDDQTVEIQNDPGVNGFTPDT